MCTKYGKQMSNNNFKHHALHNQAVCQYIHLSGVQLENLSVGWNKNREIGNEIVWDEDLINIVDIPGVGGNHFSP